VEIAVRSILPLIAKVLRPASGVIAAVGCIGSAAAMTPPKLLPHAAGYTVKIEATSSLGSVTGGRGALQLEWMQDCDGVAYSQQSLLTLYYNDGSNADSEVRISSWEAADAASYRFFTKHSIDGQVTSEVDGRAERLSDGSLKVAYTEPEEQDQKMPRGIIFPWQQLRRLLDKANAGEVLDWHQLLRGEADGDPADVSVRILPMKTALPAEFVDTGNFGDLLRPEGWRFVSAYFEAPAETLPDFEIAETVLASGVITQADITYPDFVMRIRLNKLTRMPIPVCGQ
jgi:hypothetical protein